MAKIRGIKPEFWTDEDVVELSIAARLLFIGMWNFACDNGHLDDKPKQIRMKVFPGDQVDVDALLSELVEHGRIERTEGVITIRRFAEHQKPHKRWWTTCDQPWCNEPEGTSSTPNNGGSGVSQGGPQPLQHGGTPVGHGGTTADGDGDGDGDVDGDVDGELTRAGKPRTARKRATQLPKGFAPNDTHRRIATERDLDLDGELLRFTDHHLAKGSTFKDWDRAFNNWLRNGYSRPTRHPRDAAQQAWGRETPPSPPPDVIDDPQALAQWQRDWRDGKPVPTSDGTTRRRAS